MALPDWLSELRSPLDEKLGTIVTELTPARVVGKLPVEGNQQVFGLLHGGANAVLIETLASLGAYAHAKELGKGVVGVDLNVTHLRSTTAGIVTCVATAVKLGKQLAVYEAEIRNDEGQLTAKGKLTCQLIELR